MKTNRKTHRARSAAHSATAPQSPVVRHILDGVIRCAVRGDRGMIAMLARHLGGAMVAHAEEHMARFDMDAEDVVQNVFLAMVERKLNCPARCECAVQWLLDTVALYAQPDLAA